MSLLSIGYNSMHILKAYLNIGSTYNKVGTLFNLIII